LPIPDLFYSFQNALSQREIFAVFYNRQTRDRSEVKGMETGQVNKKNLIAVKFQQFGDFFFFLFFNQRFAVKNFPAAKSIPIFLK